MCLVCHPFRVLLFLFVLYNHVIPSGFINFITPSELLIEKFEATLGQFELGWEYGEDGEDDFSGYIIISPSKCSRGVI